MPTELAITDAVLARLRGGDPWWQTEDATVPTTPSSAYAVVYPGGGTAYSDRLAYRPTNLTASWQIVCAGWSRPEVLDLVGAVRDRLTGWKPDPADRASGRLVEDGPAGPLIGDTAAGETRYSITLTFALATSRT